MALQNVWFWNGVVEGSAGLVSLISPELLFPGVSKTSEEVRKAARWWAAAVVAIGACSFALRTIPEDNVAKQAAGFGFLIYHVLVALLHIPTSRGRGNGKMYLEKKLAGLAVHSCFTAVFALQLHRAGFFERLPALLTKF